jgi:HSP20 family protein
MRQDFNRLFDEAFFRPIYKANGFASPLVDVIDKEDELVVKASLPGLSPEDVDIQITGDKLSIRAEKKNTKEDETENYLLREQTYSAFERSLTLPVTVKAEKASAKMINGELQLHLPKAEVAKAKSISIKAK